MREVRQKITDMAELQEPNSEEEKTWQVVREVGRRIRALGDFTD